MRYLSSSCDSYYARSSIHHSSFISTEHQPTHLLLLLLLLLLSYTITIPPHSYHTYLSQIHPTNCFLTVVVVVAVAAGVVVVAVVVVIVIYASRKRPRRPLGCEHHTLHTNNAQSTSTHKMSSFPPWHRHAVAVVVVVLVCLCCFPLCVSLSCSTTTQGWKTIACEVLCVTISFTMTTDQPIT